jgi:hypothetical protein
MSIGFNTQAKASVFYLSVGRFVDISLGTGLPWATKWVKDLLYD